MTARLVPAEGRALWYGPRIDYRTEGMHVLSPGDIAEIDAALARLLSFGPVDFPGITPETFPLPTLGEFFGRLGQDLLHGRGFLLLRGLPRERYSLDDIGRIYYGLGVHLGRPAAQSYQGELLGNVIDVSDVETRARGYHAGGGQRMHSDNCDVVSLMCVQPARSGGISRIVSAAAVHNTLLETRPDLLEALFGEWVFRRMELDAQYGTGPLTKKVVIFSRESGQLTCNVSGSYPHRAVQAGDALLEMLLARGLKLAILSGTIEHRVKEEAGLLGLARYFGPHIYGGTADPAQFSKRQVIDRLLREEGIHGGNLLSIGDGPVEIAQARAVGGLAIAVASDEEHNGSGKMNPYKRELLLQAGADVLIPDFRDAAALIETIFRR